MKWLVGFDLSAPSAGALKFVAWLKGQCETMRFDGVHVIAKPQYPYVMQVGLRSPAQVARLAESAMVEVTKSMEADGAFEELRAVSASKVHESLAEEFNLHGFDAVIIGRVGNQQKSLPPRLGPVARKLLRNLPGPVMIVPPDLRQSDVGDGPILLATDFGEQTKAPADFATRLALALGREMKVVHVARPLENFGPLYLPRHLIPGVRANYQRAVNEHLDKWLEQRGLSGLHGEIEYGEVVEGLISAGRRHGAAVIVSGSRGLKLPERLFYPSAASELAAHADRPIVVVPDTEATK